MVLSVPACDLSNEWHSLRQQLSKLVIAGGRCHYTFSTRLAALKLLKQAVKKNRKHAEQLLIKDGNGTKCAEYLSSIQDKLIATIYDFAVNYAIPLKNTSINEQMAIIAIGGYGRGTLAPFSDTDIMFLLPDEQTKWHESMVEYILYFLWDMGFKVGHATRNINEVIGLSISEMNIRTSVLEARFLCGRQKLFDDLVDIFFSTITNSDKSKFITAKLDERDARHYRSGNSRYLVEPNIKNGKGGLRDLHTLFWIGKYFYQVKGKNQLMAAGMFSHNEYQQFKKAENFLWAVRCNLHFITGKAEERLSFNIQPIIAQRLNYKNHAGLQSVERFMRHYFLVARDVGNLTRIFCAQLEEINAKCAPGSLRISDPENNQKKQTIEDTDFINENGRINVASDGVFFSNPVNLISIFYFSLLKNLDIHPNAMKLLHDSLKLVTIRIRENRQANQLFMKILTFGSSKSEETLRRMNESGVLGRFIPDFGKVVAMMQFNMYHHYTVDEHLLRAVGILNELKSGQLSEEMPLATRIIKDIKKLDIIYLALFLHDIAKGRTEDHSLAGEKVARKLCKRFEMSPQDTQMVAWLIREHLTMSNMAQFRDLSDQKTIYDFANIVQNMERMKYLLILTVCDIRAVGSGVWNGWKGQLIRTLYYETEALLTGGLLMLERSFHVDKIKQKLAEILLQTEKNNTDYGSLADAEKYCQQEINEIINLPHPAYFLATHINAQVRHMKLISKIRSSDQSFAIETHTSQFEAINEITVFAPEHISLLSLIAGACAKSNANIADAKIHMLSDGMVLNSIYVRRDLPTEADELRRIRRICNFLESVLRGKSDISDIKIPYKKIIHPRIKTFCIQPRVHINNNLSDDFSVIMLESLDRPGLLHKITVKIASLKLHVGSAHIATFGERVVDTFYVVDLFGKKINSDKKCQEIIKQLMLVLES